MNLILSLVLFVTTGCATEDLVALDVPTAEAPRPTPAPPPPPPIPTPVPTPEPKTCSTPPHREPCAGAIGFCPVWQCVHGEWVDVRPRKGNPHDPFGPSF